MDLLVWVINILRFRWPWKEVIDVKSAMSSSAGLFGVASLANTKTFWNPPCSGTSRNGDWVAERVAEDDRAGFVVLEGKTGFVIVLGRSHPRGVAERTTNN